VVDVDISSEILARATISPVAPHAAGDAVMVVSGNHHETLAAWPPIRRRAGNR